jgi:hypothetical protein
MSLPARIFVGAALSCGAAWLAKTALIAANGGTQTDGGIVGVLWALGMLSYLIASVAAAVALLHQQPLWQRITAAVVTAPLAFVLLNVVDGIARSAYSGDDWLRDEVGLLLVGTLAAAAAMALLVRRRRTLAT